MSSVLVNRQWLEIQCTGLISYMIAKECKSWDTGPPTHLPKKHPIVKVFAFCNKHIASCVCVAGDIPSTGGSPSSHDSPQVCKGQPQSAKWG
jgi:hypothetical protein